MKPKHDQNSGAADEMNVSDLLNAYNDLYGQLSALKHIIYASLSLTDPDAMMAAVSDQLKTFVKGRKNAVWLLDDTGCYIKIAEDGIIISPSRRSSVRQWPGEFYDNLSQGRTLTGKPDFSPAASEFTMFNAPTFFPFKGGASAGGFIVVDGVDPSERDIYQLIAQFSGIVLSISRLHQDVTRQKSELEEMTGMLMLQNEQMASLHHVGIRIAVAGDSNEICRLVTGTLVSDLGADAAMAFISDAPDRTLTCNAWSGNSKDIQGVRLNGEDQAPIAQSLTTGRITSFNDFQEPIRIGDRDVHDWTVYPLKGKHRILGVVVVVTGDAGTGDQCAILINHASIVMATLMSLDKVSEERERLAVTLGSIGDGLIATDLQGRITLMNRVARRLTGWDMKKAEGQRLKDVFHVIDEVSRKPCEAVINEIIDDPGPGVPDAQTLLVSEDGAERPIIKSGAPIKDARGRNIGAVLVFKDISDIKRFEKEVMKIQKLESLGVMAGGLAHDFNNLLTVTLGNINIAQMKLTGGHPARTALTRAEQSIEKAKELTQKFVIFSSGGMMKRSKTDMEKLLIYAADLSLSGSNVKVESVLPKDLWPVKVDADQMVQALINIFDNARQAMNDGGTIRVAAENVDAEKGRLSQNLPHLTGCYVKIAVHDAGAGIGPDILPRIFDPYFTTRSRGVKKGMGLGLTIAHTVIRKHKGDIEVQTRVGKGTSLFLYIPATSPDPENSPSRPKRGPAASRRILVMDDEDMLRDMVEEMLAHLGYEVTLAVNGEEALSIYAEAMEIGRPFAAVILDLTVQGGMGGREVVKMLKKMDPHVRAIVSTGHSSDPVISEYEAYGFMDALPKPFDIDHLNAALEKILAGDACS